MFPLHSSSSVTQHTVYCHSLIHKSILCQAYVPTAQAESGVLCRLRAKVADVCAVYTHRAQDDERPQGRG